MSENDIDFGSDDSVRDPNFELPDNSEVLLDSSSEHNTVLNGVNEILFNDVFFKIVEKRNSTTYQKNMLGIIALCQICSQKVKGSLRVSSNFISHLRKQHPKAFQKFKLAKNENRANKNKPNNFHLDLLNFICESCSPLSILDYGSFKKMFPNKIIPCRRTITRLLNENHNVLVNNIVNKLCNVQFVCLTADVWSGGKRSFFGVTCHWLDAQLLRRHSAALACRRFKGAHSFERVTELLLDVCRNYEIPVKKIVYTITDNGSNFIKAFKEFGISLTNSVDDEGESESSDADDDGENQPDFQTITPKLSKHFSCASHTLNLLATTDFLKILKNGSNNLAYERHTAAFKRCNSVWNKSNRPKSAEIIRESIGCGLPTPCVTRWNSLFDCTKKLLANKDKLHDLCQKLEVSKFKQVEIDYLEQYLKLMTPIAEAIDFLQSEENMFFGYFLPTLISLKVKMRQLCEEEIETLITARDQLLSSLLSRFRKFFFLEEVCAWDSVVAAMVLPDIKLKFCKVLAETAEAASSDVLQKKLCDYAVQFQKFVEPESSKTVQTNRKNFFNFGEEENESTGRQENCNYSQLNRQINLYLNDADTNLDCINQYPVIREIFLKYNTPLPSSAPVERLFSFAGIINRSRRQALTDSNFEKLVLKKANYKK